jgi:KUP system potassium uptake protein
MSGSTQLPKPRLVLTSYCSLVLAILAAIVASQAMITSTFQLLVQVMRMSYFPHIKVVHTSKRFHEQVYMPLANWLLMIGTVIVTAVYNNVGRPSRCARRASLANS